MADLSNLTTLDESQLQAINGGWEPEKIGEGFGTLVATAGAATAIGGPGTLLMGVGAALSCGPIGWAIVGQSCLAVSPLVINRRGFCKPTADKFKTASPDWQFYFQNFGF